MRSLAEAEAAVHPHQARAFQDQEANHPNTSSSTGQNPESRPICSGAPKATRHTGNLELPSSTQCHASKSSS